VLFTKYLELRRKVHRAYLPAQEAAHSAWGPEGAKDQTHGQMAESRRRFNEAAKKSAYDRLARESNALDGEARKVSREILKIKAADQIGIGVRAAAVPRACTVAMMATEMPAAIKPYSIAVAPDWSL